MSRGVLFALATLTVVLLISATPRFSSATFTSTTVNGANVSATNDWTPPTVSVQSPGDSVRGTATVTALAADGPGESGVASVTIQVLQPKMTSWVDLCTVATAPYTCSWNTTAVPDGAYELRATARDGAGYSSTSAPVRTTITNGYVIVLAGPGEVVRGTVPLTATVHDPALLELSAVTIEFRTSGSSGGWTTVCQDSLPPYGCSWSTTTLVSGNLYDLRATGASLTGAAYVSEVVSEVLVDNTAPTVSMIDPGTPLSGTRTFAATAGDADSGVTTVRIQYAPTGTATFTTLCTLTFTPFSCRFDTTSLAYGGYDFRAVATDAAGNTTGSALITNRQVDNTVSSVSMEDPGAYLAGTVSLTATANSTAGIVGVRIQRAAGTGAWVDVCNNSRAPYTCAWDSRTVSDGLYDFRAVLRDATGKETISSTVNARRVDNSVLRAADVQAVNGGATPGRLETGDRITYTYSGQVNLGSVLAGWDGAARTVTLRVRDGAAAAIGLTGNEDIVDFTTAGLNLGSVNLRQDFLRAKKTATFTATITAGAVTQNGAPVTAVTVVLGAVSGGGLRTVATAAALVWTPSTGVTALGTNTASSGAPATESGTSDRDF